MEARDRGKRLLSNNQLCSLEWIAWAMEAAREYNEREQEAAYQLDYSQYYCDELKVL